MSVKNIQEYVSQSFYVTSLSKATKNTPDARAISLPSCKKTLMAFMVVCIILIFAVWVVSLQQVSLPYHQFGSLCFVIISVYVHV